MELEKYAIRKQIKQGERGQIFGLIIVIACIAMGSIFAFNGFLALAGIIFGTTVVALAAIFVIGKLVQSKDSD